MAKATREDLDLTGVGAAYVRASTTKQETEEQIKAIQTFLDRNKVKIGKERWYQDHGWERDSDKVRPEFNKLLEQARKGHVQWIIIQALDRFGTKSAKRLLGYLADLEEAGCRLFDAKGKEWTGEDDATELTAWIGGRASTREQVSKSYRALGGIVATAKAGEWTGGAVRLGFDIGCFDRATRQEIFRVVFEGRDKVGTEIKRGKVRPGYSIRRLKVYPDGRTERMDGEAVYKAFPKAQYLQIVPTRDPAKLDAVRQLFHRYANESINFNRLTIWLTGLGLRNCYGNSFQWQDIRHMLADEAYLGYATFYKTRGGRFHRYDGEEGGVIEVEEELKGKVTPTNPADLIRSHRLFDPLIDRATWDKVQQKLQKRKEEEGTTPRRTPKNHELYFSGLVVCAECGRTMNICTPRKEYLCSTYDNHRNRGTLAESTCERNGIEHSLLEKYVNSYLEETGRRIELLVQSPNGDHFTDTLKKQEVAQWEGFREGIARLTGYLAQNHPDEYNAILREHSLPQEEGGPGPDEFVDAVVRCYKTNFDPTEVTAEVERLDAEHSALTEKWADLPTPLAKAKARERLATLEARIEELRKQEEDASEVVAAHYTEMHDLQTAIAKAKIAMRSETGASALRQRAEALRGIISRIECEFAVVVPVKRAGKRTKRYQLVSVTIYPITGPSERVEIGGGDPERSGGCAWTDYPDLSARPNLSTLLRIRYTV